MHFFQMVFDWRPNMIAYYLKYDCSAHYLNLLERTTTPAPILAAIKEVQKYFREHHQPAGWMKEKGGIKPQLPNTTRYVLQSVVENENEIIYSDIHEFAYFIILVAYGLDYIRLEIRNVNLTKFHPP